MKKIYLLLLFLYFSAYAQTNHFSGTWISGNCQDCSKKYIFKITIAQSNYKIVGTAEKSQAILQN